MKNIDRSYALIFVLSLSSFLIYLFKPVRTVLLIFLGIITLLSLLCTLPYPNIGTLFVDTSDSEKDKYLMQFNDDLENLAKKKHVVIDIQKVKNRKENNA